MTIAMGGDDNEAAIKAHSMDVVVGMLVGRDHSDPELYNTLAFIYQSINQSIYLSIYLSIYQILSIYLSTICDQL